MTDITPQIDHFRIAMMHLARELGLLEEWEEDIAKADHWLFVDDDGWAWCAHCEWVLHPDSYITNNKDRFRGRRPLQELYDEHVAVRERQPELEWEKEDEPWELYKVAHEYGLAENIAEGERGDEEFWPVFEHSSDWKASATVRVTRPAGFVPICGGAIPGSAEAFITETHPCRTLGMIGWPVPEDEEKETLSWPAA